MGLKITTDDRPVMVFRNEREWSGGKFTTYSLGISSKDKDGNWIKGYMDAVFKKGVEINNKAQIQINNAFPTVNVGKDGRSFVKIFVSDFSVINNGEETVENKDTGFLEISDEEMNEMPFN